MLQNMVMTYDSGDIDYAATHASSHATKMFTPSRLTRGVRAMKAQIVNKTTKRVVPGYAGAVSSKQTLADCNSSIKESCYKQQMATIVNQDLSMVSNPSDFMHTIPREAAPSSRNTISKKELVQTLAIDPNATTGAT